ncbi:YrhB domain-containing protein [Streptomyces erythrochromogenes]|uniref:YrhB domain-containing protein n=1 Tax=Streptomyces erythrochromogenes TaxID=285574 RepID=UPI00369EACE4
MIEREGAVRVVEEHLAREDREAAVLGVPWTRAVVVRVREHDLVWKVYVQSEEYARTRNPSDMLVGHGPYLVDRVDGGLHEIGMVSEAGGEWEADYRGRIRGLPVRTAVDDLHDEVREALAAHGRMAAARIMRQRLPVLSPSQALRYVSALPHGDAPAHLVALATEELVEPFKEVLGVRTIHGGSRGN